METNRTIWIFLSMVFLFVSCSNKETDNQDENNGINDDIVILTDHQLEVNEIKTGSIRKQVLHDRIECNGTIEADKTNEAQVAPVMSGYLKSIHAAVGQYVQKGEILATLTHPQYIRLQQEYLETQSQYTYYKEEFKRQGELSIDQATSLKKMQEAQNEFRKTEAKLFSLKHQLEFIGVDPEAVHVESLKPDIFLRAPISGYIVDISGIIGMFCPEEKSLFHIIGGNHNHLHLKVFESHAGKISPGQTVTFYLLSNTEEKFKAEVKALSHNLNENNLINLFAAISEQDERFYPGMYVKANIEVSSDSAYVVPAGAVAFENENRFLFVKLEKNRFKAIPVQIGRTEDNLIEITSFPNELIEAEIAVEGAYELHAAYTK